MKIEYTKRVFTDLQIKIHEARRKIDYLRELSSYGIIPQDDEVLAAHAILIEMTSDLTKYYAQMLLDFKDLEIEHIEIEDVKSNVIPFKKREE